MVQSVACTLYPSLAQGTMVALVLMVRLVACLVLFVTANL